MPNVASQLSPNAAKPREIFAAQWALAALIAAADPHIGTVLLIPGYTGSKEDFAPIMDPLAAAGYTAVSVDQPGQFESPGPHDPDFYSVDNLGAVVNAAAQALVAARPGPIHLVGHSFGGLVARAAVLAAPHQFATLTLMSSGPAALPAGDRTRLMEATEPLLSQGLEAVYDATLHALATNSRKRLATGELAAFFRKRFVTGSSAALLGMGTALRSEPNRVFELAQTGIPKLVLHGPADDAWSPQAQATMAVDLRADHVVIDGAMHSPAIEEPSATVAALVRHFQQRV